MKLSSHRAGVAVEPRRFLFQKAFGNRNGSPPAVAGAAIAGTPRASDFDIAPLAFPLLGNGEGEERDAPCTLPSILANAHKKKKKKDVTFVSCLRRLGSRVAHGDTAALLASL
ncbi:hypothetical protein ISCGN_026857 [Ixodes scapularis]